MSKIIIYESGKITISNGKGRNHADCQRIGRNKKMYTIDNRIYTLIVSAARKLSKEAQRAINFYTFTFAFDPDELRANKAISEFFKRLKRKYGGLNYVWTKERQSNGRLHYHCLIDSGFIPVKDLQKMWNDCILHNFGDVPISNNSFRLPPLCNRKIFDSKDAISIGKYIAKYITKERNKPYERRCYAISDSLQPLFREISQAELESYIDTFGTFYHKQHEFCAVMQLNNDA